MKRIIIATILGIAGSVTTFGQGLVTFSTYFSSSSMVLVEYSPGHPVGAGFSAELYYGLGSNIPFAGMTALSDSITTVGIGLPGGITGPLVEIPDYMSGAISFGILILGPGGSSTLSPTWTEPSIPAGVAYPGMFTYSILQSTFPTDPLTGFPAIYVVPEPGAMTPVGVVGALTVLIYCKRQKRKATRFSRT